ncbi:hypothetical protein CMV_018577 [Castanea mollissima]|uniref:Uncharacterized protein n=1 Tax=Castanea mollissima TaxID=60419 RepID=A0A8J4R358_9ROSI|nr:hypothetical protein CMV_018577 [Castanea mollissima]
MLLCFGIENTGFLIIHLWYGGGVTILVAVKGALNMPEIKSTEDLRTALHYLNTISSTNTLAVEVLWSPQAEHDTLSEDELLENYPLLGPI